jgi:hypothetical protein
MINTKPLRAIGWGQTSKKKQTKMCEKGREDVAPQSRKLAAARMNVKEMSATKLHCSFPSLFFAPSIK